MEPTWLNVAPKTAADYNRSVKKLENIFEKPFETITKLPLADLEAKINKLELKPSSKYVLWKVISKWNTQNGHPRQDIIEKMLKQNESGELKSKKPINLDTNLREKWKTLQPLFDKVFLSLFIEYSPLRSDLSTIKLTNYDSATDNYYKDHTFYFNKLVKNSHEHQFQIRPEHRQLFDEYLKDNDTEWFWGRQMTANAFLKTLRRLSLKHFGAEHSVDYYRKLHVSTELESAKTPREFVAKQKEMAKAMNNSVAVQSDYYLHDIPTPPPRAPKKDKPITVQIDGKIIVLLTDSHPEVRQFLDFLKNIA